MVAVDPRWRPTWLLRLGRSGRERIRIGGVFIAPAARITTLHSISSVWPFGWREGLSPSLSMWLAVTT